MCVLVCTCAHVPRGGADPPERRSGSSSLFLISPALCGFPAVTGLRVETGTNEQLRPAWLPGCQGLWDYRLSVALSLPSFFTFVLPLAPFTLLFTLSLALHCFLSFLIFHSSSSVLIPLYPVCVWIKSFRTLLNYGLTEILQTRQAKLKGSG